MNIINCFHKVQDRFSHKVDTKLLEYIDRRVNKDDSIIEKAIGIYLCLGDVLCYSPRFSLDYDYSATSCVKDISVDNNEIICKNWAFLYKRILGIYGISAMVVCNTFHYKVEIVHCGTIYSCDATGYGGNKYHYSMSDIARIKCGFLIDRFMVADTVDPYDMNLFSYKINELKMQINNVYKKQGRKIIPDDRISRLKIKVKDSIVKHSKKVGEGTLEDIEYRINYINRFWKLNIIGSPLEKAILFNHFLITVLDFGDEHTVKSYNLYGIINGKITIFKLLAIEIDNAYYYYLDDGSSFGRCTSKELLYEMNRRNLKLKVETEIIGIYSDLQCYKLKRAY